jgi:hypothetical protein
MGPSKKLLSPLKAYRYVTVIAHVNLFDLAATERAAINARKTYQKDFSGRSYTDIINDYNMKGGGGKVGFNSTEGRGEGSKIKTRRDLTRRDLVAAASYFISEGRGSGYAPYNLRSLRYDVGIKGADLVEDIYNTFIYFKGKGSVKPDPIDQAGPGTINLLNAGKPEIQKNLKMLGINYTKLGKVDIGEKERGINILINVSGESGNAFGVSKSNIKGIVNFLDKDQDPKAKTIISLVGSKSKTKEASSVIKEIIKENSQNLFIGKALRVIEASFRKIKGNENFRFPKEVYANAGAGKIALEQFVNDLVNNPLLEKLNEADKKKVRTISKKQFGLDYLEDEKNMN